MSLLKHKLTHFGLLFLARIAGAGSLFAVNLLIVHFLGLESLATYAVFVSLVSIFAIIISTGFSAIAPIIVAEYTSKNQPELLKGFVQSALKQGAGLAVILAVGILLSGLIAPQFINSELYNLAPAVLFASAATAFIGFSGAALVGMKRQMAGLLPEIFVRPVVFFALSAMFLVTGVATNVSEVIWLLTGSIWIALGFVLVRDRKLHRNFPGKADLRDRKRWRNASLPWMGISILWDFMIDILLLLTSVFAGSIEIAMLHICFRYRVLAGFGMRIIHTLMMPEITESVLNEGRIATNRKLFQLNLASFLYALSVIAGFWLLGDFLLGIFSIESDLALPALLVISATMVIKSIFGPAPLLLAIHRHHTATLWASILGVIGAAAFIASAFGSIGIMSAAIGYTAANFLVSVMLCYITRRKTGINCSIFSGFGHIKNYMQRARTSSAVTSQ